MVLDYAMDPNLILQEKALARCNKISTGFSFHGTELSMVIYFILIKL